MTGKANQPAALNHLPADVTERFGDHGFLFNDSGLDAYLDALARSGRQVRVAVERAAKPFSGKRPQELQPEIDAIDLAQPCARFDEALAELEHIYLRDAVYFHHPRYVAHLNCPIAIPAIAAEVILSSINSSLDTWDQSAGGTLIEQKLIDWTAGRIGFAATADGVFTSGGTQSNLMALLLARDAYCRRFGEHVNKFSGLPDDFRKLRILTSRLSHFSVQKAASILGLGYEAVVPVACDHRYRMDLAALRDAIESCRREELLPMAVVATAGTTDFGSIDPLREIAAVCEEHGLWMHTDAAYGCGLLASERHRDMLDGIELSDSVTVDYHKSFFQPVSCAALVVKDRQHLNCVTHHADYLNPESAKKAGTPNLVDKSIQTTRRFDALKLWMTFRTAGVPAIGKAFDEVIALARQTWQLLVAEPELEVLHRPELSALVFRYFPNDKLGEAQIDGINLGIRQALFRGGDAVIAGTRVNCRQYLKFTLLNPATSMQDIREIIELIKTYGQRLVTDALRKEEPTDE